MWVWVIVREMKSQGQPLQLSSQSPAAPSKSIHDLAVVLPHLVMVACSSLNIQWVTLGLWLAGDSSIPAMIPRSLNSWQLFYHFAWETGNAGTHWFAFPIPNKGCTYFLLGFNLSLFLPRPSQKMENLACINSIMEVRNKY